MKYIAYLYIIFSLFSSKLYSQEIELKKTFLGYKFVQNDETIKINQVYKSLESNTEAFELIKKAKTNNTISAVVGFVGGGMMGWSAGKAISGDKFNWTLFGIGTGISIVSIPISIKSIKDAKQAVEIYNSSLKTTAQVNFKPQLNIIASGHGIGLYMTF